MSEKFYSLSRHSTEDLISHVCDYISYTLDLPVKKIGDNTRTLIEIRAFGVTSGMPTFIDSAPFFPAYVVINIAFEKEDSRVKVSYDYSGLGLSIIGNLVEGFRVLRIMKGIIAEIDRYML